MHAVDDWGADTNDASIPLSYSRIIGRVLGLQVRELPQLLKWTSVSLDTFLHDDGCISRQTQIQILKNAAALSTDPLWGLKLGRTLSSSTHGAMGFLINSSPNLLIALEAAQQFMPTRMSIITLQLHKLPDMVVCQVHFDRQVDATLAITLSEMITGIFFEHAEFLTGRTLDEVEIDFQHAKPDYPYQDYLSGRHQFNQPYFSIRIPHSICLIPNSCANQHSYVLANHECEKILSQLSPTPNTVTYRVQKCLLSQRLGEVSEKDTASALFVSTRTLHRQLQKEQTSFKAIREQVLAKQAAAYLGNPQISIDAIAALLGYHDAANFRRAFRRWFATTPSEYRKTLQASAE